MPQEGGRQTSPLYVSQESSQTLAEGLEEYYRINAGVVTRPEDLPEASRSLFAGHDVCHVIFGLTTDPLDETLVDTRAMVSTTIGARRYAAYLGSDPATKAIFAQFGFWRLARITVVALPRIVVALFEALRMRRRWEWSPPPELYGRSLAELRAEFGIRIV
ncbi:MAG: hypothetical protein ACREEH_09805 [Caulobacteraceae bacterium]